MRGRSAFEAPERFISRTIQEFHASGISIEEILPRLREIARTTGIKRAAFDVKTSRFVLAMTDGTTLLVDEDGKKSSRVQTSTLTVTGPRSKKKSTPRRTNRVRGRGSRQLESRNMPSGISPLPQIEMPIYDFSQDTPAIIIPDISATPLRISDKQQPVNSAPAAYIVYGDGDSVVQITENDLTVLATDAANAKIQAEGEATISTIKMRDLPVTISKTTDSPVLTFSGPGGEPINGFSVNLDAICKGDPLYKPSVAANVSLSSSFTGNYNTLAVYLDSYYGPPQGQLVFTNFVLFQITDTYEVWYLGTKQWGSGTPDKVAIASEARQRMNDTGWGPKVKLCPVTSLTVTIPTAPQETVVKSGFELTVSSPDDRINGFKIDLLTLCQSRAYAFDYNTAFDSLIDASYARAVSSDVTVLAVRIYFYFQHYYSQHDYALIAFKNDGSVTYLGDVYGNLSPSEALDQATSKVNNPTTADLAARVTLRPADPQNSVTYATANNGSLVITNVNLSGNIILNVLNGAGQVLGTHPVATYPAGTVDILKATSYQVSADGNTALVVFRDAVARGLRLFLVNTGTGDINVLAEPSADAGNRGTLAGRAWLDTSGVVAVAIGDSAASQPNYQPAILTWGLDGSSHQTPLAGNVVNATFDTAAHTVNVYYVSPSGQVRGDVNGDGDLNAQDILIPINAINNLGSTSIDVGILPENMKWYLTDWDGNSLIEPSDILASINKINARTVEYVTAEPFIVSADGAITALVRPAVAQSTAQPDAQKITGDGEDTVISMKAEAAIIKAQRALASTGTAVDLNAVNRIFANIGDSSGPVVLFDMTGPIGVIAADNNRSAIDITANSQV